MFRDFGSAAKASSAPVTVGVVALTVVCFVGIWMSHFQILGALAFTPAVAFSKPWTFITYSFANVQAVSALFLALWLWMVGGMVERELGSVKYLIVWLLASILSALCVLVGTLILHPPTGDILAGGWIAATSITVIWATRNPNVQVLFMFVIPLAAKWLAWISVAFVFFATAPELAPFAALPFILAYLFAANKLPFAPYARGGGGGSYGGATKKWERYDKNYYSEVQRREKERDEKERLRKLFEGSLDDDPEKDR
jgi:membrane associated rhomboid family serine protease